jgi:hypothetical protein
VTTGGSEAILFVVAALCDPGDQILVFEPFYANYAGFSSLVGRGSGGDHHRARRMATTFPARAVIEKAIGPRTRAILVCSPNNPTGTVYTDEEMELLADLCARHDLWLVSDEAYREFTYDGLTHHSALLLSWDPRPGGGGGQPEQARVPVRRPHRQCRLPQPGADERHPEDGPGAPVPSHPGAVGGHRLRGRAALPTSRG